ncbi:hypothetical protein [Psychromonas sp. SR45-3]|uniref:hypothetical protein n=1 Tax=Psychromonas sp. SR45-3 TaxID=2760930 RepID=UPI0015FD7559|nr:hypothetical protein [Psychromonas sp. SR45-3]MBB1271937.1 hypothetical protein [Psychromonas sp. SR45-3]
MSILLKKSQYLMTLFSDLSRHDNAIINKNIDDTLYLLKVVSTKTRQLMAEQNVPIEDLLADKCLPLTRFYLSDEHSQLAYFLNSERLALFFSALPMAEATIFQQYVIRAKKSLILPERQPSSGVEDLTYFSTSFEEDNEGYHQLTYLQSLQNLVKVVSANSEVDYKALFYDLQSFKKSNGKIDTRLLVYLEYQDNLLFYCELSPLWQLKAQQLFTEQTAM